MTAVAPAPLRRPGSTRSKAWLAAAGGLAVAAIWEVVGRTGIAGNTWPALSDVVGNLFSPSNRTLFIHASSATLSAAGMGYVIGVVVALFGAGLTEVLPLASGGVDRLAAVLHAIPVVALGPVFIATVGLDRTPIAVAALSVFFTVFVAATSGLRRSRALANDVLSVLGASRWARLAHLRAPAALPVLAGGLRLCAPAAILGAIIGEWFGTQTGLGVLIVSAMSNFQITLLWSAALLSALLSLAAYGLLGLLEGAVVARFSES